MFSPLRRTHDGQSLGLINYYGRCQHDWKLSMCVVHALHHFKWVQLTLNGNCVCSELSNFILMLLMCESALQSNLTTVPVEPLTSSASKSLLRFSIIRVPMHRSILFSNPVVCVTSSFIIQYAGSVFGINSLLATVSNMSFAFRRWTVLLICCSIALLISEHCARVGVRIRGDIPSPTSLMYSWAVWSHL